VGVTSTLNFLWRPHSHDGERMDRIENQPLLLSGKGRVKVDWCSKPLPSLSEWYDGRKEREAVKGLSSGG
jgi:hypothetical protein